MPRNQTEGEVAKYPSFVPLGCLTCLAVGRAEILIMFFPPVPFCLHCLLNSSYPVCLCSSNFFLYFFPPPCHFYREGLVITSFVIDSCARGIDKVV